MNRREFGALGAGAALAGLMGPAAAQAQGVPLEGKHFVRVAPRQPTLDPKRIEVVEFFWYGCPHCHSFEPALDAWQKKLPADVLFRRMPVAFRPTPFVLHQQLYFAIETLGLVDQLHRKVFYAMHVERNPLDKPETIGDFVAKNGVERDTFMDVMNSFAVQTKARQAATLSAGYKIDGTPALGVDGRYFTSGSLVGSNDGALSVADYLIGQARKGA